jgi:hypothetical protein
MIRLTLLTLEFEQNSGDRSVLNRRRIFAGLLKDSAYLVNVTREEKDG